MAEVNVPINTTVEDPEHVKAMLAKATSGETPETGEKPAAGKPEWLGDFETPEDMAKAYKELRAKMSSDGAPKVDEKPAEATPEAAPEATREAAEAAVEKAGIDMAAVESEFFEAGELSEKTYADLEKAGFDKATVDRYIAGQQAVQSQLQSRVEEHVGGADRLQSVLEWAVSGLSQAEATAFNNTIDNADEAGVKLALDGLMAKYDAVNGKEPSLVNGEVKGNSGSVFRSTSELTAAMRDPRYSNDPAYRADVEARLARSDIF